MNDFIELNHVANLILEDKTDIIEGCRRIVSIRNHLELNEDHDFLPIVAFVSEIDDYPNKEASGRFNEEYLLKIRREVNSYIKIVKPTLQNACATIIKKYPVT
ncbi:hypothetical protein L4D15_23340 [Enterovibrio norvegicus]|uniref:hypothetical protein n=1 Tax=Enterovibrio norvegicus TaxID=188144 RepID=UPI003D1393C2